MRRSGRLSTVIALLSRPLILVGVVLLALFGLYDRLIEVVVFKPLTQEASESLLGTLLNHGFWIALAVVLLGFVLQFYKVAIGRPLVVPSAEHAAATAQRIRQTMLARVRSMWVEGVLEQSLYQVAQIELGLSDAPEAIEHPWKLVAQQPERAPRVLPAGIPMREVFDEFDKTLLILGAPGSGKTTLLLELTRDLIERAKDDPAHPIPVVFNLSSWAVIRPALTEWLADELHQRYDIPRKVADEWVQNDEILPLLDGLDEVALAHREACVETINAFRAEHGLVPLVVSSRTADYEALSGRLRLPGAVAIEPLTREQVEQYLARAGTALSGVRVAVRGDETLWELLDTPLMLSVLALAYQGRPKALVRIARLKGSLEERRAALFNTYIDAMFRRREAQSLYIPQQTRHWLSWLARAMARHEQTVFYLERMQPDWLPKVRARLQSFSSRMGIGLLGGLVLGLGIGLLGGLVLGLGVGLVYGLVGDLVGGKGYIKPAEAIRWSWKRIGIGLLGGLGIGLLGGLGVKLVDGHVDELYRGLVVWLLVGLLVGLFVGLVKHELHTRTIPNEGIRRSLKNSLVYGLVYGLVLGLGIGLFRGLFRGLLVGLVVWLLVGLSKGGSACIRHGVLRLFLWRYDYAPLDYVRFLEHAKDRLFLRRVGGGYIFVHRMLMEHFAGLGKGG